MTDEEATREDLDQFKTFLLQQLSQHKTELSEQFRKATQAAESTHQISTQLQLGADISFKKAGNEKFSFKFNSGVPDKLQNALSMSSVEDKDLIQEAVGLLEERNRKIRIANSSEAGWLTVKHYESNPVALNSEDDKKIRAAEKEALRERGRNKYKRNVDRSQSRGFQYSSYAGRFPGQRNPFRLSNQSSQFRQHDQPRGSCHFGGNSSFWWRECPVRLNITTSSSPPYYHRPPMMFPRSSRMFPGNCPGA